MKLQGIMALAVAALLGAGGSGLANPSYQGATGLFFAPTAEVTPDGAYSIGLFADPGSPGHRNWYTLTYGIHEVVEVALLKWNWDIGEGEATALGAKFKALSLEDQGLQVAVGVNNVTEESGGWEHIGGSNQTQVYVVGSRTLVTSPWAKRKGVPEIRGHLGLIGGTPESNLFLGVEIPLVRGFTVVAENFNEQTNVGARLGLLPHLTAHVAFLDLSDPDTVIGVAYSQGF